ncbi:MAG: lipid II:glycine glycyltransferase FemX [Planctomycetota bacterium]
MEVLITDSWNDYLRFFQAGNKDVYFTQEYVALYENGVNENKADNAECFIYKQDDNVFMFPYIKGRVDLLGERYFDFKTPYGYGGPIANTTDRSFVHKAFEEFLYHAAKNKIIAGLIRYHPLLNNQKLLPGRHDVVFNRNTVAVDLTQSLDIIWSKHVHLKHRNSIRKATESGLEYIVDKDMKYLDIFVEIYRATMARLKAEEFYYFSNEYFDRVSKFGDNVFLGLVRLNRKVISAALFLRYGRFGHYHLAGSLEDYQRYNPNNFLIYNTLRYLKETGAELFHLGGGNSSSPDDGLFRFKKRFSKNQYSFYISRLVLNEGIYGELCSIWGERFPEKKDKYKHFLLKYKQ